MPFHVSDEQIERRLDELALIQPARISKSSFTTAILRRAVSMADEDFNDWLYAPTQIEPQTSPPHPDPLPVLPGAPGAPGVTQTVEVQRS